MVWDGVKRRAKELGHKAVQELAASERASHSVAEALRLAQEGRRVLDEHGARLLNSVGLATRDDLDRVSRKVGRLRKKLVALLEKLEDDAAK